MLSTDQTPGSSPAPSEPFGSSRKSRLTSFGALFLALCAFGAAGVAPMAPDPAELPVKLVSEELAIPSLTEQIELLESAQDIYLHEERVRPGDNLASLLNRLGVDDDAAERFIKSDSTARAIVNLRPGKRVLAYTTRSGQLERLTASLSDSVTEPVKTITVLRFDSGFATSETVAQLERRIEMRTGEIRSSLFAATDAAQIPDSIAMQIVDMFATNIDFASDLRRGDRFNVVYETFWQNGEPVRPGRVLAGEFLNAGNRYQSVWFDDPTSKQGGGYYTFDGKSLKKAFLKSPLEFSRISSGFAMRRHPISGMWKQHQGVDFAAPTGTPIRASGDGTVEYVGKQNGYGNLVILKHWNNYTTAYAHMSRFASGLRNGSKVSQGEVIGYVGATGWATGPHLHYEFRVNNTPRDPMSIDIRNAQALAGVSLEHFRSVADDIRHRFSLLNPQQPTTLQLAAK